MQVAIQSLQINVPVNMHDAVAKTHHFAHLLGILVIQITRLSQDAKDISLFLRSIQPVYGDDVVPYVSATFSGSLESSFDGQLYGKILLKLLKTERLLLL
jgi:hypothetical protein